LALWFMHGVAAEWKVAAAYRNYVPRDWFEQHLRRRGTPYAAWAADREDGDFLSVDDATRAGTDACRIARALGHEVLFFVNPLQVITGAPYFFSVLDAALDSSTVSSVVYAGESFDLTMSSNVRRLRRAVKARLMLLRAEDALAGAYDIARKLGADVSILPPHCAPVTVDEIRQLRDEGVRIENHGWSHVEISGLADQQFAEHISAARSWLQNELTVPATLYAVPFGLSDVTPKRHHHVRDGYFLADENKPPHRLGPLCWNRHDLTDLFRDSRP
jgi:hypothetical protein